MIDRDDLTGLYYAAVDVQQAIGVLVERLEAVLPEPESPEPTVTTDETGEPTKRLTIDIPESLHTRMMLACGGDRQKMADAIRALLEEQWPEAA